MKIHTFEQYSPEWWETRYGKFTASEAGPFMLSNSTKVAQKARLNLICEKLGELAGHPPEPIFPTADMKRGTALEPIARAQYAKLFSCHVREVGFVEDEHLPAGCSPDGLVYANEEWKIEDLLHGVEIKAPAAKAQNRYLLTNELPSEYEHQIHMSLAISGLPHWDFFSFCPKVLQWTKTRDEWICEEWEEGNIPPFFIRTYRSAFTDKLSAGLRDLCAEFSMRKQEMAQLWKERKQAP